MEIQPEPGDNGGADIEAKEVRKRSESRLSIPQQAEATGSSYKRSKRPAQQEKPTRRGIQQKEETCSYCRGRGHKKNAPTRIRRTECPAFRTKCDNCGKPHHLEKVCRQSHTKHQSAMSDFVCTVNTYDTEPPQVPPWTTTSTTSPMAGG